MTNSKLIFIIYKLIMWKSGTMLIILLLHYPANARPFKSEFKVRFNASLL
jgi:hypothetical protein